MFAVFATSSGLGGLLTDAREFLAAVRFARVDALWLMLLLPAMSLLNWWAIRQRTRAMNTIGRAAAVAGQLTHPRTRNRWHGFVWWLAWTLLVLGIAGPRWGKSDEPGVAVGRDIVLVIDLSRSMLAEDMTDANVKSRWNAAREGALDLLTTIARRGGHRVGIVVFASKPKVVCPLTTDYQHARAILEDLNGEFPPPECKPGADPNVVSGTRIGAALLLAVETHDSRFAQSQDILLFSDGDDPEDDKEWIRGANAARAVNIPIHTIGIGNPLRPSVLELGEELVSTQLQEPPLQQIAAETKGHYIAARTDVPRLGEFFRNHIEPNRTRVIVGEDQVPQPKERYAWFLAPALGLFWLRFRAHS